MLMGVVFSQDCNRSNWEQYYNSDGHEMTQCELWRANLRRANLSGANLSGANFDMAVLKEANLSEANLSEANLNRADFDMAILSAANLSAANLSAANLHLAYLNNANLSGANLSGANFDMAVLKGANLTEANLTGANLSEAKLEGVVSGCITGTPKILPEGWSLVDGRLINDEWGSSIPNNDSEGRALSYELFQEFGTGEDYNRCGITLAEWEYWMIKNYKLEVSDEGLNFSILDKDKNGIISEDEFYLFYQHKSDLEKLIDSLKESRKNQ